MRRPALAAVTSAMPPASPRGSALQEPVDRPALVAVAPGGGQTAREHVESGRPARLLSDDPLTAGTGALAGIQPLGDVVAAWSSAMRRTWRSSLLAATIARRPSRSKRLAMAARCGSGRCRPRAPAGPARSLQGAQHLAHGRPADPAAGAGPARPPAGPADSGLQVGHKLLADLHEQRLADPSRVVA